MILQDVRYGLRTMAHSPGFVAMAVVALGLGIGANTTVFSFVNAYLLRPLPTVKDANRLAQVNCQRRGNWAGVSYLDFLDWEKQNHVFESLSAVNYLNPVLTGQGEPDRLAGVRVSPGFFDVFGMRPAVGRGFLPAENAAGGEPVILLSDGFWQRRFGGREMIGQSLALDGVSYKIVGIMPPRFRFSWSDPDFYAPLAMDAVTTPRGRRMLEVTARLRRGVTFAAAQAEMSTIARRLELAYPETNQEIRASVQDLTYQLGEGPREAIYILSGIVIFVLLIACANVANLQLARATGRTSEIAIRAAMGASRWRIAAQVLTESIMVAMLGGVLGLGLGFAGAKVLMATVPPQVHPINEDFMDLTVLAFTGGVALLTGILSGLAPAFQISRVSVNETLKEGGRAGTGGARGRLRGVFVVAEVSLAMMLLLAAGLLVKSFNLLLEVNPGFRVDSLLTARVWLPNAKYPRPELRAAFFRDLVDRVAALPGAQSAAASTSIPMTGGGSGTAFVVEGQPTPPAGHELIGRTRSITPGYFQTIGIPLVRGRYFTEQDDAGAERVVIVNDRMAQQFFPGQDPIGKRVKWSADPTSQAPWRTIAGVTGNVKPYGLGSQPVVEMFAPSYQEPSPAMFLLIRTQSADPSGLAAPLRTELRNLDRDQPINGVRSMKDIVENSLVESKYMTLLTTIFAGIALLMAAMGIYGVISYSVAQRTRELGLRMALGAGTANVVKLVLRQALWLVGIGIGIGVPCAAAVTRVLQAYLYGVGPRDPATFILIPAVLAAVALVASYVPAKRATRVDPMIALRYE